MVAEEPEHREVLVVGCGPGGATAARRLAQEGVDVLAIERRAIVGNPTQCGECVPNWGEVIEAFPNLGENEWLIDAFDFPDRVRLHRLDWMRLFTPSMKKAYGLELDAFSAHRPQLDGYIAEQAERAGAEVRTNTALRKVLNQPKLGREVYITTNGRYTADHVIDASGALAHVARLRRGDDPAQRPGDQIPTVYAQVTGDIPDSFDIFLGNVAPKGYAWIIPKGDTANVGLGVRAGRLGQTMLKDHLIKFCEKLDFEVLSYGGGWIPMAGPVSKMVDGNVLAIGDAAGLVMPSNGGGIAQAMISGKFAAESIISNRDYGTPLEEYQKRVMHVFRKPLKYSLRSKKLLYTFFRNDFMTETLMRTVGPFGALRRAVECKPPLWIL